MSITTEYTRLKNAKADIKASITGKGVTVPEGTKLDGMPALIDKIKQVDLTGDTVTPETLLSGETAHNANGVAITGNYVANSKTYTITLAKSSGWVLLTQLDQEVLEHINDESLVVTLINMSDYVYSWYTGYMYMCANKVIVNYGSNVYGMAHRMQKETNCATGSIVHPANNTQRGSVGDKLGKFLIEGNNYYIAPGDGFIAAGDYRLTFTW
ncbi:MAG: hypothetical protein SOW80_11625 [Anaerovoracaceae bacterium]|nr:hypothetical protein [Anaerovoracaceae bacterium]